MEVLWEDGIIVFDLDDVLVDFSIEMYNNIRLNWRKYSRYFINKGILKNKELMERNVYNINEWLIKPQYKELTSGQYSALQLKIFGSLTKDFFGTDIYKNMVPNDFAKRTIMNPIYIESNIIKKVYILSRSITKEQMESKKAFVEKYFKSPKVEFIDVRSLDKKGEVIKKLGINFDLFVDDELPNIRNVAEVFDSLEGKEFLIPIYGYNKMQPDIQSLIEEKGGITIYYDPFKKENLR